MQALYVLINEILEQVFVQRQASAARTGSSRKNRAVRNAYRGWLAIACRFPVLVRLHALLDELTSVW